MKLINKKFLAAAKECAQYIMDQDCEGDSYNDWCEEGHDPRDHIVYHSAVVLDCESEFEEDIQRYEQLKEKE